MKSDIIYQLENKNRLKRKFNKNNYSTMKPTTDEIINAVTEMRRCQKEFFKTRDASYLRRAKELEKQVDELIDQYNGKPQPQDTNQLNIFQ